MFYNEINQPAESKKESNRVVKSCAKTVFWCSLYIAAAVMMFDKPAYQSDCVGDTLTCSQETGE